MSAAMTIEVTMEVCAVPTQLNFLLEKRSTNEAEVSALSQNLVALKARLEEKEEALAKHSQDFRNAVEAICKKSSRLEYCEMSMFDAQEEARLAVINATEEMQAAAAAVATGEDGLQTAVDERNSLNASIQDEEARVAELETLEQQRKAAEEEQRRERRLQLSVVFHRNQAKGIKDQKKLKLAEEEFIARCISAEEFLAEHQKRLDDEAATAAAEAEAAAALKQQRKEATATINEQISTAATTRQALFNRDATMIATYGVSNMCHTQQRRTAVMPPAIIVHGAAAAAAATAAPVTAPPACPATTSARDMMDDVCTLDDEDLFQDDGAHYSTASSPGLHEVEVMNEGADVRDTSLNVPVDEPQVSGTPNEDAGRTSTTTTTERPEAAQPEAVQPEAAQTTEEAAPTVLASLQDLLASPLPKIVEWITHCLMNSPPGVAQGVLTMLHSAGGGVHIPVYKLLAVPPPADASAPTTSTAADPLPVPPPPPQQLPATTSSADSQQPPPPSSLPSSTPRQQQFRSATSQPSTSAQSDQQQPPPTPVPSVSTRQPRSSDSQRASTSQCGSSATSGGCRVRVVMFSFYLFLSLAGEHNLRTLTKFQ